MIAVTGANGLLGSFVVKKLVEENLPVVAIVRKDSNRDLLLSCRERIFLREADVVNVPSLTEALQGARMVIHVAAVVSFSKRRDKKVFEVNVEGTRNVVDACLNGGIPKIIHVSSVTALGRQKGVETVDEEARWVESSYNTSYAKSKYLAELEMFRGMEEGLSVSMVNPSVILAPSDWTKSSSQLFAYAWKENIFYTEGVLNYVDVRDVTEMIFTLCTGDYNGEKFIANAGWIPLKRLLEEIATRFGKHPPFVKVKGPWMEIIARMEELRSLLTGAEPLITRQSVRMASESFQYNSQKAKDVLRCNFRTIADTLDWCCEEYLRKINTNK